MAEMKSYSLKRMDSAIWLSIGFTVVLYFLVSIFAASIFGNATDEDILVNLSKASLSQYMHSSFAAAISYTISLSYVLKLLSIYPLENWCVREVISLVTGGPPRPDGFRFYAISYGITILAYFVSLYVKSIYLIAGVVGGLGSATLSFIVPGLLTLRSEYGKYHKIALAVLFFSLGAVGIFHGSFAQIWRVAKGTPFYC